MYVRAYAMPCGLGTATATVVMPQASLVRQGTHPFSQLLMRIQRISGSVVTSGTIASASSFAEPFMYLRMTAIEGTVVVTERNSHSN